MIGRLYIIFREVSIQVLCQFLNWLFVFLLLNCSGYLSILDLIPLSNVRFTNIFSHSVRWLFTFLIMSFAAQFLILMKSDLFIFPFVSHTFSVIVKNSLPNQKSWRFTPMFSTMTFMLLALVFRLLIHFELIFVYDVK